MVRRGCDCDNEEAHTPVERNSHFYECEIDRGDSPVSEQEAVPVLVLGGESS